jgi:hypothetical protein
MQAVPIDIAFVNALPKLLAPSYQAEGAGRKPRTDDLKVRIGRALAADDLHGASALLEELRANLLYAETPESSEQRDAEMLAPANVGRYQAWAAASLDHPERVPVSTTQQLRVQLKTWFHRVELVPLDGGL